MKSIFCAALAVSAGLCLRADRLDPKVVPQDAVWLVHLDLEKISNARSGVCGWLYEQGDQPQAAVGMTAAQRALGIDLRKDLKSLTVFGLSSDESQATALLKGTFNKEMLLAKLIDTDGYAVTTNDNCEIHAWNKRDNPVEYHYGAFHSTNLLVFASEAETLVNSLQVLAGRKSGGENATLLKMAAGEGHILTAAFQSDEPLKWPQAGMLRNADAGALFLTESDDLVTVRLMLNVTDPAQADNLFNAAQGLKAMAQLNAKTKPKAADIAKNIVVERHEQAISMTLTSPSDEAVKMLEEAVEIRTEAAHERRRNRDAPQRQRAPFQ